MLRTVVEMAVLATLDPGEAFPLRRPIARQFVGDDHPGHALAPLQQLGEELLGRVLIPPTLDQDIQDMAP
jgi:hypothetical protein